MSDLPEQVGRRLSQLRDEQGMSLSELARRAGIGKGTLSELESGRRNPTLETLYALTTALGTHLTAVLSAPVEHAELSGTAVDARLIERFEDGAAVTEVFRIRIRAGQRQQSGAHTAGATEHLVAVTGTAVVGPATAPLQAGPGEHVEWAADVPHVYGAPSGDVEAVLVVRYPTTRTASTPADRHVEG
ncbi:helix-turn-helix domain-containing protein [Actinomycetota bacterium Odt1-20B]